tara:strand:+ start:1539 stop:2096 length:558 start_codon:yes stop_codon:yes gene_type:complete
MTNLKGQIEVNTNELETILLAMPKGSTFAKVLQYTTPKTTKKDRDTKEAFIGKIQKLTALTVLLNSKYANGVKNQLDRENKEHSEYKQGANTMEIDFTESENNFCGTFKGKAVIQYRPFDNSYPTTKFIMDNKLTDKDKLPNVLPTKSKATNQGTEKEIFWRKLYVSNIRKIKIDGIIYKNIECK